MLQAEWESAQSIQSIGRGRRFLLPLALMALGFGLRLANAAHRFLNADEALHYLLTLHGTLGRTYQASLAVNHPPLLIIALHYWGRLGHSEFFLRLPCVFAGTLFCWIMFCWLRRVRGDSSAPILLALLSLAPPLVLISAEIRQYAFLLLFSAAALYFLDQSIEEHSPVAALLSGFALSLALLSHFAALIVALTLGIYALLRFASNAVNRPVFFAWVAGQSCALGVVIFLFAYNWPAIKARNAPQAVAASYLRRSVFWPGEESPWTFVGRNTIRVFHYFFDQGAVGVLALVVFLCGIVILIRGQHPVRARQPSSRQLAFLFLLPFVVNSITGLLRLYPYGGSRHNVYLAIFAMPAIAVALTEWCPRRKWWKSVAVAVALTVCYLFPHPQDEYIRWRNQNRRLMTGAVAALSALPRNSTIFTDDQGGLLLSYYLCHSRAVQIEQRPYQPFLEARCGDYRVISLDPNLWIFKAETFADTLRRVQRTYDLPPGSPLWLFQAGWYVDQESALRLELSDYGCMPSQDFGKNMVFCRLTVPGS
jgi:hypothetical protein